MKLCSNCLFRAQDAAKICMTCGSTALQKLEFTAEDYSLNSKLTNYIGDMRAAYVLIEPRVVMAWKSLYGFCLELRALCPQFISAFKKVRALVSLSLPAAPAGRRVSALSTPKSISTARDDSPSSSSSSKTPTIKQNSVPVLLRNISNDNAQGDETGELRRPLPILLRNIDAKRR